MHSSYGTTGMSPVLAAGMGVRHGRPRALRAASFRLEVPVMGRPCIGIVITWDGSRTAVVDLLAGLARPAYGELRVLGQDLTTAGGRAAVRRNVGTGTCRNGRPAQAARGPGPLKVPLRLPPIG